MASDGRSYVTGIFALDLDGVACGIVQSFQGGDIAGDVVSLPMAHDYYIKKHIGNVTYAPYDLKMGLAMGQPVKDWIDASLAMNYMRKSGELKAMDFKREVRHIREFNDALITEIGFPACAAAGKDPAFLNLKFAPWRTRNKKGDGSKGENPTDWAQKQWLPTDFRLQIDGLAQPMAKVSALDSLVVKQTTALDAVGPERDYFLEPAKIDYPNLKFTMSEEYSHDLFAWHEDFVINGNNEEDKHKNGTLEYLNRPRTKTLLTLTFSGLGIFKISSLPRTNHEEKIASVVVECYMENLTSQFG